MTQEELNNVIERHQHWLKKDCEGWENMRADLSREDLSKLYLLGADLSHADLTEASLVFADLDFVNLSEASLIRTNLVGANLVGANLKGANLDSAFLNLANLRGADLTGANLDTADLSQANLIEANLVRANLNDAFLEYANLSRASLDEDESWRLGTILEEPVKGYKKTIEGNIIELEIPAGAIVFSINNRCCRTNKAIVKKCDGIQHSYHDQSFEYKEGDAIEVKGFNMQYNLECAEGIHFFKTKDEAEGFKARFISKRLY